jgi:hypothetical protein
MNRAGGNDLIEVEEIQSRKAYHPARWIVL